jgi:hypothetical protein
MKGSCVESWLLLVVLESLQTGYISDVGYEIWGYCVSPRSTRASSHSHFSFIYAFAWPKSSYFYSYLKVEGASSLRSPLVSPTGSGMLLLRDKVFCFLLLPFKPDVFAWEPGELCDAKETKLSTGRIRRVWHHVIVGREWMTRAFTFLGRAGGR